MIVVALAAACMPSSSAGAVAQRHDPQAVVAIMDSGINPYHATFRDDSKLARRHPSTYIPNYPKDAIPLRLSLNESKYWEAVKKDCERVWSKVKTGRLYWFPGTKIIGAITFAPLEPINCHAPEPAAFGRILDSDGHGTMTASRAASNEYGACSECRVVAVQFSLNALNKQDAMDSIGWAAKNAAWIDAQSNSWGPLLPAWEPTGAGQLTTANPEVVRKVEEVSRAHLAFWASGNGAAFRFGAAGHPTLLSPHMTPSALIVGGHDSGYVAAWPGFPPHVVSDACSSWAAYHDQMEKSAEDVGGGTSAATPFAAGGAVQILLEARRILGDDETGIDGKVVAQGKSGRVVNGPLADGKLTLAEWRRVLLVTATPRPRGQDEDGPPCGATSTPYNATPVKWTDVPAGYPEYLQIGYGSVDDDSLKLAFSVLAGRTDLPDRSATDRFFEQDRMLRETLYEVWSKP
jgi:hypothetical protein